MSLRPPEAYTAITDELARLATCEAASKFLSVISRLGLNCMPHPGQLAAASSASIPPGADERRNIGIWQPVVQNGITGYVRMSSAEDTLWSRTDKIPPKNKLKRRIVFLGESAARGYFYDPHTNCATVLEGILQTVDGGWEVIDLARTGMLQGQLLHVLRASTAFQPDAVVLFAGNNWMPFQDLSWIEIAELANKIESAGSWLPVRPYLEAKVRGRTRSLLKHLNDVSVHLGIPVVIVVPEFNLKDWRTHGLDLPFLGADTRRWLEVRICLEEAAAKHDRGRTAELAAEMTAIDGASTPRALQILGQHALEAGNRIEARRFLEQARDTEMIYPRQNTPRCFSAIQEELRNAGQRYRFTIVDLPLRFEEHLDDLPDRRLFLDYCHLTFEGIRLAMGCVAESLLQHSGKPQARLAELCACGSSPATQALGMASLLAAWMNSSYGQDSELVHYHCSEALRLDAQLADQIYNMLDSLTRRQPFVFCASFRRFAAAKPDAARYYMNPFLPNGKAANDKPSQLSLVRTCIELLEPTRPSLGAEYSQLQAAQRGLRPGRTINLLQPYYHSGCHGSSILPDGAFYKAREIRSSFVLFCEEPSDIELKICYRVPKRKSNGVKFCLQFNGTCVCSLDIEHSWVTRQIVILAGQVRIGCNDLDITWPISDQPWGLNFQDRVRELRQHGETYPNSFYPIFGEIGSLTVRVAGGRVPAA